MTIRPLVLAGLALAGTLPGLAPVPAAAGGVADLHGAWRGCLHRSFGLQASLSGRMLAADAALRSCRGAEDAYLAALSASPLLDVEDVGRVRPALLMRAKDWLLGRRTSPI
jgi:hypothetical protein